jgi:hypothetical protein
MTSLRTALREHYESREPRPAVVERLLARAAGRTRSGAPQRRRWVPAAAAVTVFFAWLLLRQSEPWPKRSR